MKINRQELLNILTLVKPALAKKDLTPQTTHFMFTGTEVATYNGKICIMHPFETDFTFTVKGEEFFKLLSGVTEEEVELTQEAEQIRLKSKKTSAGMACFVVSDHLGNGILKMKDTMPAGPWKKLPYDFLRGVHFSMFTAAKDLTKGEYVSVHFNDKLIETADGDSRASNFTMQSEFPDTLIAVQDIVELVKLPVTQYHLPPTAQMIHFITPDYVTFSCMRRTGKYLPTDKYFDITGQPLTLPLELQGAVRSVVFLSEGEVEMEKKINVEIKDGTISCSAKNETGWVVKEVPIDYKGQTLSFQINPIFFAEMLEKSTNATIAEDRILFSTDNSRCILSLWRK